MGESYGKAQVADVILTLSRKETEKLKGKKIRKIRGMRNNMRKITGIKIRKITGMTIAITIRSRRRRLLR